jgi:hypothetical protein
MSKEHYGNVYVRHYFHRLTQPTGEYVANCVCGWVHTCQSYIGAKAILEDHIKQMKKEDEMSEVKVLEMETDGYSSTIISNTIFLDGSPSWERDNLKPNTKYACVMIPLPEGYRLATVEELKELPKKSQALIDFEWLISGREGRSADKDYIYAVPIETSQDAKVKELQQKLKDAEEQVKAVRKEMKALK